MLRGSGYRSSRYGGFAEPRRRSLGGRLLRLIALAAGLAALVWLVAAPFVELPAPTREITTPVDLDALAAPE